MQVLDTSENDEARMTNEGRSSNDEIVAWRVSSRTPKAFGVRDLANTVFDIQVSLCDPRVLVRSLICARNDKHGAASDSVHPERWRSEKLDGFKASS